MTNVIFVDSNGFSIAGVGSGPPITETILDIPPVAHITAVSLPTGSRACTPLSGAECTPYAFLFDGSSSADPDGTIPNPGGFFWDFGDNTQDLGISGSIVDHDYGQSGAAVPGRFVVTLRVQDNSNDTGSSRDFDGNVVVNIQPSHAYATVLADNPPIANFTVTPNLNDAQSPNFNASSSAPGQAGTTIASYTWNFGDGTPPVTTTMVDTTHTYMSAGSFNVTLIVEDNLGAKSAAVYWAVMIPCVGPCQKAVGGTRLPVDEFALLTPFVVAAAVIFGSIGAAVSYINHFRYRSRRNQRVPTSSEKL